MVTNSYLDLFFIVIILFQYLWFKRKKIVFMKKIMSLEEMLRKEPLNLEKDIEMLIFLIETKVKLYVDYKESTTGKTGLNTKYFKELYADIIKDINVSMSKNYKKILLRYFSPVGLSDYIARIVRGKLIDYMRKNNILEK